MDGDYGFSNRSRHRRTLITSKRSPSKMICLTGFLPLSVACFSQSRTSIQRTSPSELRITSITGNAGFVEELLGFKCSPVAIKERHHAPDGAYLDYGHKKQTVPPQLSCQISDLPTAAKLAYPMRRDFSSRAILLAPRPFLRRFWPSPLRQFLAG